MALPLSKLQIPVGEVGRYTTGYRNLIENYLQALKVDITTVAMDISPNDEYRFTGDFYALLLEYGIGQDIFWITMRLNGLHSPLDYNGDLKIILVPSVSLLDTLLTRFMSVTTLT